MFYGVPCGNAPSNDRSWVRVRLLQPGVLVVLSIFWDCCGRSGVRSVDSADNTDLQKESRGRLFDDGNAHSVSRLRDQSGSNYFIWERVADVDPVDSEPGPRADPVHIAYILRGQEVRREAKAEADI